MKKYTLETLTRQDLENMSLLEVEQAWEQIKEEGSHKEYDEEFVLVDNFLDELLSLQNKIGCEIISCDTARKEKFTETKICNKEDEKIADEKMWDKLMDWSYNRCKQYVDFFNK